MGDILERAAEQALAKKFYSDAGDLEELAERIDAWYPPLAFRSGARKTTTGTALAPVPSPKDDEK